MNKIKICHIVSRITGRADGIFKHLLAQFTLLDKSVFNHFLICPFTKEIQKEMNKNGIKTYFVPELDNRNYFRALVKIKNILYDNDFDIVCCHTLKPLVFGGYLSFFRERKIVFFSHGIFIDNDYNSLFEKFIYKVLLKILFTFRNIYVLCPSEWNKNKLLNEFGKSIKNVLVYHDGEAVVTSDNGAEDLYRIKEQLKTVNSKCKIIYAGRLAREKDPFLALDIFKDLNRDKVSLHFFGEGELEDKLVEYSKNKKIHNVFFHGYVKNVSKFFKDFDVLILTSKREGMPIVLWEAMFEGVPFVSKKVGGVSEILKYGDCGLTFETKDKAVEMIQKLIDNPKLMEEMKAVGKRVLLNHFSKENFINFFTSFYKSLK